MKKAIEKDGIAYYSANASDALMSLLRETQTVKTPIKMASLFEELGKQYAALIDRDVAFPAFSSEYVYAAEKGFLFVFTVIYSSMRLLCGKLNVAASSQGETVALALHGALPESFGYYSGAERIAQAMNLSEEEINALLCVATSSGFSVSFEFAEKELFVTFSLLRFRSMPTVAYSCASDSVAETVKNALRMLLREK